VDHIVYGWVFFALITFLLLAIGTWFRDGADVPTAGGHGSIPHRAAATHRFLLAGLVALAPLSAARLYGYHLDQTPVIGSAHLASPAAQAPWHESTGSSDPLPPVFAGADAELHARYEDGTARAYLHVGYFLRDRRGAQAVSSAHDFEGANGWKTAAAGTVSVQFEDEPLSVRFTRSVRGGVGHLVWYWYWVDGQFIGDPYIAKLLETKAKLVSGERASAVIAISADYADDASDAEKALRAFSSALRGLAAKLNEASRP
jgi:EpsI family protein